MKVLNLFGGPGSGKSTTAAGVFYRMKLYHMNVELVTEYAKDLVYSDKHQFLQTNQEYVFAEQNRRQFVLRNKVDWAITDSPLVLSHVYGKIYNSVSSELFLDYVADTFNSYDNVNIFLKRPTNFSPVGRVQSLEESQQVDKAILNVLKTLNIKYKAIFADDNTVENILAHLKI